MRRILSILTTLLLSLTAMAQRYSVTVTPVLLPPYTLNLSELTAQGSAKMMATLTVNDLTAVNLPVRLHFKLESAGITIENIPTSAVAPMFLNGGETQILTGSDMAQYLRLDNLEFRGYSKESYRETGQLPGGMWKVSVEVRHFNTGRVLSNHGSVTFWVSIYDPPVLTAPRNNTEAPDNPSLPLVFSWQASKHTGGTVAVQYKLELWEMRMEGVPAQTVAASMTPIFETTTQVTSYTAIPTIMNLEPGIRYCWRVTVSDPSNQAQINKNGQSEVREFTYLHTCPPVDEVTATVRNTQADFSWTPSPYHTHFRVEMLQEGGSSDVSDCYDSKFRLYDFPQGTTWRVRVRGECKGDLVADWSPWTDFSIDPPGTPPTNDECPDCGCDDGPAKRNIENYELKELQPGDTIVNRTGRTRFIVLSAEATGDHIYSGQFYLWLELWRTKVRCDYTDLKVNTDGVILDGSWRSVHNDGLMVNPATVAENIQNIRNGIANATFDNTVRDTIKLGYAVQTIYKDENGRYIAILEDGSEHDLTQDLSTANKTMVEDSQGNKMVVTGDQQLMSAEQYHNTGKNNTLLKNDSQTKDKQIAASGDVIFKPSESQQFGFDAYDAATNDHTEIYPALEDGSYRPAYKSVAQWQQDKVAAEPMSNGVTFRTNMGVPYAIVNGDIVLRGEPIAGETPVYAHMAETDSTTKVVGKLNLLTFEPKEISVCLVPVNGATLPNTQTLEKELNKIFKPAVASVKLSTHSGITIDYADGSGFVHGGSGPLTVYSNDEKAAINALTDANDDTYYLFLVKNVTKLDADGNNTVVSGYMPVGYQHGFIFEQFDVVRTYAHELSHGAFALHHTFSANTESFHADEGTTNNLMDYTESGITLNHKQWTWMHEKHGSGLFGFLADEESGEMIAATDKDSLDINILSMNADFAPGVGMLSVNYQIGEKSRRMCEKYPNEQVKFVCIVSDSIGNVVFNTTQDIQDNNIIVWDGYKDEAKINPIKYEDGPYKLSISLAFGTQIEHYKDVHSWQEFKDFLYQDFIGDSIMYVSTYIDTTFNILQGAALEWIKYPDMHRFLTGQTEEKKYDSYKYLREIYMNYEGIKKTGNPFEWIKRNFTTVKFLEQNLFVHKNFAEVLDYVQQSLIDVGIYDEVVAKYKNSIGTMCMRSMNDPNGANKISEHGLGMAIDFLPQKNPQILASNKYVAFYIKQMTGFDIGSKKTVDQIKNAHNEFIAKFINVPIDTLINDFDIIDKYESDINNISLYDLNQMIKFVKDSVFLSSDNPNDTQNKVTIIKKVLNIIPHYLRCMVNKENAILQGKQLLADLNQILYTDSLNDNLNYDKYVEFESSIKAFAENIQVNFQNESLSKFGLNLKKGISNIGFGNNLLSDGFCDMEREIIDAFINSNNNIQWGGIFSKKIDPMHFGFTTSEATKIINGE